MQPYPLVIRTAGVDDILLLCSIARQTFLDAFDKLNDPEDNHSFINEHFTTDKIRESLLTPGVIYLLAFVKQQPVGYAKLSNHEIPSAFKKATPIKMEKLYFLKSFTGKGLGEKLFRYCTQWASLHGYSHIWLFVWDRNLPALRFYDRLGFTPFGQDVQIVGSDVQIAIMMQKKI
ncbi:GNAT family N-acetyltransferase [Pseudobacter ginsenosidimutans]|uniref:Ribosomal protein S18 acetylase RimI-like enzyme n=1 Tax=Pseudobacter ginsenosidimutans TaxID=661488 RepID=A0A4Q7MSV9_9BACT|nr:GNAT family N-acetyltransferase [Pseudobacter ginsenosidimutans]QEC41314.1 GNAT family N-acetyltransferase [Pseudobacter ginsenosidimutans]RZS71912.1 ribosomal protein S18 acetylase RimI-like enzyme [Pseudobacter ginsenosidimutans]